jgi:hypothetical protein
MSNNCSPAELMTIYDSTPQGIALLAMRAAAAIAGCPTRQRNELRRVLRSHRDAASILAPNVALVLDVMEVAVRDLQHGGTADEHSKEDN